MFFKNNLYNFCLSKKSQFSILNKEINGNQEFGEQACQSGRREFASDGVNGVLLGKAHRILSGQNTC